MTAPVVTEKHRRMAATIWDRLLTGERAIERLSIMLAEAEARGETRGEEQMRERAAQYVLSEISKELGEYLAAGIRALPIGGKP